MTDHARRAEAKSVPLKRSPAWRGLPWPLAEIRRLGDWGNASNHLGRAWEEYGAARILSDGKSWPLPSGESYRPIQFLRFGIDDILGPKLHSAGRRAPDGLLLGRAADNRPVVQPIDFKFSLDHAEAGQIQPEIAIAAAELFGNSFASLIRRSLGEPPQADWGDWVVAGALVAPPSLSNRQTPVPDRPILRWLNIDVSSFYDTLPASAAAAWLRSLDRVPSTGQDLDLAEAYYRLGAGVAGAVSRLDQPLFSLTEPGEVAIAAVARLSQAASRLNAVTTADLVERLRPAITKRRDIRRRLNQLLRRPADRATMNRALGLPPETSMEDWPVQARQALADASARDQAELLARGNSLLATGLSEEGALAALMAGQRERGHRFADLLRDASSRT